MNQKTPIELAREDAARLSIARNKNPAFSDEAIRHQYMDVEAEDDWLIQAFLPARQDAEKLRMTLEHARNALESRLECEGDDDTLIFTIEEALSQYGGGE